MYTNQKPVKIEDISKLGNKILQDYNIYGIEAFVVTIFIVHNSFSKQTIENLKKSL